jgi:hypothetical protein
MKYPADNAIKTVVIKDDHVKIPLPKKGFRYLLPRISNAMIINPTIKAFM